MKNKIVSMLLASVMVVSLLSGCGSSERTGSYNVPASVDGAVNETASKENGQNELLVKKTYYKEDGSISSWTTYEYDTFGNQTKITEYLDHGNMKWEEYEYDDLGNMTKRTCHNNYIGSLGKPDGKGTVYEYKYDDLGNVTKVIYFNEEDSSIIYEYENNDSGVTAKADRHLNSDVPTYSKEYDRFGNLTRFISYRADGSIYIEKDYTITGIFGIEVVTAMYEVDSGSLETVEHEYEYDSFGNLIKLDDYEFEYDSFGNLTKYIRKDKNDGRVLERGEAEYEFR